MSQLPEMNQQTNQSNNLDTVIHESKIELNDIEERKIKKGRGRPKKDGSTDNKVINHPIIKSPTNPLAYKDSIKSVILFSGVFLSTGFKFEGFKISEAEAEQLAVSGSDVASQFMPAFDEKYVKLGAFLIAVISVYGIRAYQYQEYLRLEKLKLQSNVNSNEVQTNR